MLRFTKSIPTMDESQQIATLVLWIVVIHFVVEAFIMGTLSGWNLTRDVILEGILDCAMLTVLTTPPIYFWVVKPFVISARDAKAALSRELSLRTEQAARLETALASLEKIFVQNEQLRNRLQRSSERIADINELTWQRIGADLHDGPAQLLTYSLLRLGKFTPIIESSGAPNAVEELGNMRSALEDALKDIRNISRGLSLPQLDTATLGEVVAMAVTLHQEQSGSRVEVLTNGLPTDVPHSLKAGIYRVVQESLSNAYKHGKGVNQKVSLTMDKQLILRISDEGPGFETEKVNRDGLGLTGMRARVEALGGTMEIESRKGLGTAVTVRFEIERSRRQEAKNGKEI